MKKPVLVDFKILNGNSRVRFGKLPAGEKDRLNFIAQKAKQFIQDNDCRIHGGRYQSLLITVVDGQIDIQVNACCAEYAKDLRQLEWLDFADSFSVVHPGIGGDLYNS